MKELEEIYQEMLDCFAQRTGLEAAESCDLAVRFYAVAAQVYALYAQADWVLRQCFPQTAAGSCLDSHAQLRGLSRKQATAAEGSIRFSVARAADTDRPIPAGTVCMTPGLIRFETAQAAVLEAGASWVDVPARALTPGSAGNVPAGAVTAMAAAPVGIAACTNPAPFAGGGDEEGGTRACASGCLAPSGGCPTGPTPHFTSMGPSPLTRWPRRPYCPGAGAGVRWTWWRPPWRGCRTRSCWAS